jgi:4-amino-4-deoxy-L-arabinose transferase-like glycosyltransferase
VKKNFWERGKSMPKRMFWIFLVLALLVVILRIPSFDLPLDADSGVNAFFARQIIRGETLYDKFHPAHHLPGIYYTFVTAFEIFGDHPTALKLLLLPFVIMEVWLIFWIGHLFFNDLTGLLAALFFALGTSQIHLDGLTDQMELFANLPLIINMFILMTLLRSNPSARQYIWVGIVGAICILYKIVFVAPLMVAGIAICLLFWLERDVPGSGRHFLSRIVWTGIGTILPLLSVAGYFATKGLWQRVALVFTLGFNYLGDADTFGNLTFSIPFGYPLFMMVLNNAAMLVCGVFGMGLLILRAIPLKSREDLIGMVIALWMIISFMLAGLRGGGYAHYILTTIPPLALAAGYGITKAYERWKAASPTRAFISTALITGLIILFFYVTNNDLYRSYFPYKQGLISAEEFSARISNFSVADVRPIANYLQVHTEKQDYIYIWSTDVQLYYLADRTPPIDILWTDYISATGPAERIFHENTKYIVVRKLKMANRPEFPRPQWFVDGLARNYTLETTLGNHEIYRRSAP